jgi:hypothetical protein
MCLCQYPQKSGLALRFTATMEASLSPAAHVFSDSRRFSLLAYDRAAWREGALVRRPLGALFPFRRIGRFPCRSLSKDSMKNASKIIQLPLDKLFPVLSWQNEYWQTLGKFIEMISLVEFALNFVVVKYANVRFDTAKALLLPLRIDGASQALSRIIETKHLKGKNIDELQEILIQIGHIVRVRNDIVHFGVSRKATHYAVSNIIFARSRQKIRTTRISRKVFHDMIYDLHDILFRLSRHAGFLSKKEKITTDNEATVRASRILRGTYRGPIRISWLYKPRQPSARRRKRRETIPKQKRPPSPSAE